ncbi:hypothetical protein TSUD_258440 [Trifolium subterraneum]|uniref:Uncharacterized protein n=1 Tax=Trifolium subterraneum TaxID=3900 RepID=A0A2Z6N8N7_TRISU|nr:hypothetical protein TSUD_258440 [Trifolium subterraneum]
MKGSSSKGSKTNMGDRRNKHPRPNNVLYPGMKFTGVLNGAFPGGYFLTINVRNGFGLQGKAYFSPEKFAQVEGAAGNLNRVYQNTKTKKLCIGIDLNENPSEYQIEDDYLSDYSDFEMPASSEEHVPDPLLVSNKFVPIVIKPTNPSTGVPIDEPSSLNKGKNIVENSSPLIPKGYGRDPFDLWRFPSPALSITPPDDLALNIQRN